jgi:hypothetical protein
MKKSLRNLAKVAAGLGAAYALTKMGRSPEEKGLDIARSETRDLASDEALAPRKGMFEASDESLKTARAIGKDSAFYQMEGGKQNIRDTFESDTAGQTGSLGQRGSVEGFKADDAARKARIESLRGSQNSDRKKSLAEFDEKVKTYNRSIRGAKKGKMMMASKGGSVVARGNKLARSKPTKLF